MGAFDDLIPQGGQAKPQGAFSDLVPQGARKSAPSGLIRGMKDPIDGGAQLLTHILPDSVVSAGNRFNNWLADKTGLVSKIPEQGGLDALVKQDEQAYQAARQAAGESGTDWARVAGNILSPANAAVSVAAPIRAATIAGRAAQGARAGAVGAAMAPVHDGDFLEEKLLQAGVGAASGGVLTPVIGKAADALAKKAVHEPVYTSFRADEIMREGVNRLRSEGVEVTPQMINQLRQQVVTSLQSGEAVDAAALMRKADFDALGISPTLGQITRDPGQFAREKNLAGVSGVGDPLLLRINQQSQQLYDAISKRAAGSADNFSAGQSIMGQLKQVDDQMAGQVSDAYGAARDHLGRAAPMNSGQFSQSANAVLDEQMLGSSLPSEARDILNKVSLGEIPFNVNSAVLIDRRLSEMQRDATRQGKGSAATAIGVIRDALNKAPIEDNVGEDAKAMFDTARGMARDRFKQLETIPALKAAADGDISADDFVRRFIVNGKTEDVLALSKILPQESADEARRQIGAVLQRAAFGDNVGGANNFSQERFASTVRKLGRQKLEAFFGPDEVDELERIARVGAYINSVPSGAPVNTSNTAAAAMNLVSRIPGAPAGLGLLQAAKNAASNQMAVDAALKATPSVSKEGLTPAQKALVQRLLGVTAVGSGSAFSGAVE